MKNPERFEKFIISQKGIFIRDEKVLFLKLKNPRLGWDFPGGRLDRGEVGEQAFQREIKEELGFDDFEILGVVDYDIWITPQGIPVCGIANLIKNDSDEPLMSVEHTEMHWVKEEEIDNYMFLWPNAKRMVRKGCSFYPLCF